MCRLLGVVSRGPRPLTDTLSGLLDPFTALSCEHADGWGVAAWRDGELSVAKDTSPAHASKAYAQALSPATDAALLHLRKASPGLPVTPGNTHPFTAGTLAFAHNGGFSPEHALDGLIDAEILRGGVGSTDSERFFLRVLTRLRSTDPDPVDAIARTAADVRAHASFSSLNCLLLTQDALYAYAEEDPESEASRRRGPDFFPLWYRARQDSVVVASSGIGAGDGWQVLPYGQVLEIRRADLRVSTHAVLSGV
ncbi:class II glutamine amidotransferase [Streptacidiphilus albus]|uniref:class II glutamine amidotransferase n=1 Tax=Streptacidiphilus albus TaxID=105425 RepID=UPI00054B3D9C|nr:class II glutamine amidotransferase [Streptacidiphilus albus]